VPLGARARTILKSLAESSASAAGSTRFSTEQSQVGSAKSGRVKGLAFGNRSARRMQREALRNSEAAPAPGIAPENETNREEAAAPASHGGAVVPLPLRELPGRRPSSSPSVVAPAAAPPATAPKSDKKYLRVSALLAIALPTLLATLYFGFVAAPQYVAEARFAVRGAEEAATPTDAISALSGFGGVATGIVSDSYIVAQYITSTQIVGNLQRSVDLRRAYTSDKADFVAKYRPYDFEDTIEHLATYWNSVAWVYYEPLSGIISFTVRAFTPEDALKIAKEAVRESENVVNKLSERAREDAISLAKQEQARAELRLKVARKSVQDYRDRKGQTDPVTTAAAKSTLVATLEMELAKAEADIAGRTAFLSKDSPSVRVARQTADALRSQIEQERAKIGALETKNPKVLMSTDLTEYEGLQTELTFAQKAYETASVQVEATRVRAEQQTRYLATFVEPHLPEDSLYPKRLQMILLVMLCSALAWAIGVLVFYGIRDHTA